MTTVGEAQAALTARFRAAGIDSARLDARVLLAHVAGVAPLQVVSRPERTLSDDEQARLADLALRRERREPISHLLGEREFWSLPFAVTADTLTPRPDSETVVEAVLAETLDRARPWAVLDLGTGTGCLLLALLSELRAARGVGVDVSPAALAVATRNAAALGLAQRAEMVLGDWGSGLDRLFDVIVSNPPYIPDQDIPALDAEVAAYEPFLALAGGADGLTCYRAIASQATRLLHPGGLLVVEVGQGQAGDVSDLFRAAGLTGCAVRRDLGGIDRCVLARCPGKSSEG